MYISIVEIDRVARVEQLINVHCLHVRGGIIKLKFEISMDLFFICGVT